MTLPLPDKWVRKAIYDIINDIVVNTVTFPCYDLRATKYVGDNYVILSTQTNNYNDGTKCGHHYDSSILLDVVTKYRGVGNPGSRLLADDAANAIIQALDGFTLDAGSGLRINSIRQNTEPDIIDINNRQNVVRKFIRYELTIN